MEATGGCLCGAIRYRVKGLPQATSLCHCESCRRATGGPSLAWAIFAEGDVEITSGELAIYASSPGVERGFCARCGTSLSYARANRPGLFDVTTASLDDPEAFPPAVEIWTSERLCWEAANPALRQFAQFSTPPGAA
ncbi:MAG TPA: GFA family protein [Allosphingosinicella sp.]|nr:GFA family protein [Allosphingosinicella sp.]